ncbi:hypothetical protein [Sphingomonas montana]|uniref:hypothetical protein n=1 Tax=Sphingomonas montana TaxID=1843236 RepID=UPI00101AD0CE|nr:hypothetical protein [Sphingomonas montana]
MTEPEWTRMDLDLIHSMVEGGGTTEQIARRLGRTEADIDAILPTALARDSAVPVQDAGHGANKWFGADEEGDVPPPTGRPLDDPAAWVHTDDSNPTR